MFSQFHKVDQTTFWQVQVVVWWHLCSGQHTHNMLGTAHTTDCYTDTDSSPVEMLGHI